MNKKTKLRKFNPKNEKHIEIAQETYQSIKEAREDFNVDHDDHEDDLSAKRFFRNRTKPVMTLDEAMFEVGKQMRKK